MKILQVFDFFSLPHGGGTVDIVYKLSQALANRGHEVTICTGDYELDQNYIDSLDNVKVNLLHSLVNMHGFYIMPDLMNYDIQGYDIIHLHCYRSYQNAVLCHKARKYGIPYIIDAHGSTVGLPGKKQLIRKGYDKVFGYRELEGASRVIAETSVGIEEYEALGVALHKCVMIHPLLDIEEFAALPPKETFRDKYNIREQYIVLFIGRIHWAKGIENLVEAVSVLKGTDIRLVLVGQDDGYKDTLERLIAVRGLSDKVLFTGYLTGDDKIAALVDADVLVQPSKNEAGARPSLEAILCNTPVIVTKDTGAGKEIEKMDGGCLVEYGNINRMSFSIQQMLVFPAESSRKTQAAKQYIKDKLSMDKQIGQYEQLYHEVVA